jgi:hypothetical protein
VPAGAHSSQVILAPSNSTRNSRTRTTDRTPFPVVDIRPRGFGREGLCARTGVLRGSFYAGMKLDTRIESYLLVACVTHTERGTLDVVCLGCPTYGKNRRGK